MRVVSANYRIWSNINGFHWGSRQWYRVWEMVGLMNAQRQAHRRSRANEYVVFRVCFVECLYLDD